MTALSQLVGWVLAAFYSLIPSYGVAIILLGGTFMLLVAPLTLKSTRSMLAMQKLQPKLKQLQQQHKNDRLALNQAVTELYRSEGVSPFGACIPTLIPLPLFYVLYRVIVGLHNTVKNGASYGSGRTCAFVHGCADPLYLNPHTRMWTDLVNSVHGQGPAQIHSFGLNLATSAWTAISTHLGVGEVFGSLLLLLIMIGANFYQQLQIMNLNPMVRQNQQANPQMQIMRFFPIIFGLICVRLPSGLVLYYAVSALFRVSQQWLMYRYDPKVKALVAKDDRDIEVLGTTLDVESRERPRAAPARSRPQPSAGTKPAGTAKRATQPASPPKGLPGTNGAVTGKPAAKPAGAPSGGQRNRNRRRRGR